MQTLSRSLGFIHRSTRLVECERGHLCLIMIITSSWRLGKERKIKPCRTLQERTFSVARRVRRSDIWCLVSPWIAGRNAWPWRWGWAGHRGTGVRGTSGCPNVPPICTRPLLFGDAEHTVSSFCIAKLPGN